MAAEDPQWLEKLIVDKVAFAISAGVVILWAGHYLSRALERYKASYAFALKFAEARMTAYRELNCCLGRLRIELGVMREIRMMPIEQKQQIDKARCDKVFAEVEKLMDDFKMVLPQNSLFISESAANMVAEIQDVLIKIRAEWAFGENDGNAEPKWAGHVDTFHDVYVRFHCLLEHELVRITRPDRSFWQCCKEWLRAIPRE